MSGFGVSLRTAGAAVICAALAVACTAALLLAQTPRALAAGPCVGTVMYVAAHQDDTLLFQSPQLLEDVRANKCVFTVFTTAGDAGKLGEGGKYWKGREAGAEAGYAEMAGVADTWTSSALPANGRSIHLMTLNEQPGITIAYMRLPDGGPDGKGFPLPGGGPSLTKLWRDGHAEAPAITEIEAVDGSAKYTYEALVKTLGAMIESFAPLELNTQNYPAPGLVGLDHSDHIVTGKFTQIAQVPYKAAHLLRGYRGYEVFVSGVSEMAANVTGTLLEDKEDAFFAYTPHDEACGTDEDCSAAPYPEWLEREYVAATESTPGANAGPNQNVASEASVQLDGSGSFDPGKGALTYAWTQTAGPAVTLSNPNAQKPTLTAPVGPQTLTFALKVDNGPHESLPSSVTISVAKPTAPPKFTSGTVASFTTGVAGNFTIAADGSPLPAITRTAGSLPPGLTLVDQGDGTARLSGTPDLSAAPAGGSREYAIGLKAQNSVSSDTQTLTVTVTNPTFPGGGGGGGGGNPPPPPPRENIVVKLSKAKVKLVVGKPSKHLIKVIAPGKSGVKCRGQLPKGARCRVNAQGNVVIESSKSVTQAGTFHLVVGFAY